MKKIYVVGMGPGGMAEMTPRAIDALIKCDYIIGYYTYIDLIKKYFPQKQLISTGMGGEVERCKLALKKALEDYTIALVSSGDSGIYGMAGLMLEIANRENSSIPVEVIPGITAASAAAAVLGAPLMHDFAVISLSDYLTPWELIYRRIQSAAASDFVLCFYNPRSKSRTEYIAIARDELLKYRPASTPVGIVWNAGRQGEASVITTLEKMLEHDIDMFSTVIVGNSQTYVKNSKMITPRGYKLGGGVEESCNSDY
ncbi:MAG: precorrin-3B C(17)-methyltransferase [Firmicutes bacterium]|nr:precorrin-3B C(17)-methyltransferase [Bacillota bacterium]